MKRVAPTKLDNLGSLITFKDGDVDRCLGYLMHFDGRGTYDPTFGRVEVTKEQADIHNKALEAAELSGLDQNCAVGQGGTFYYNADGHTVRTFLGTVVSEHLETKGNMRANKTITFHRAGKVYRGRLSKHHDAFNFRRVS
jgi:hypothetical protein